MEMLLRQSMLAERGLPGLDHRRRPAGIDLVAAEIWVMLHHGPVHPTGSPVPGVRRLDFRQHGRIAKMAMLPRPRQCALVQVQVGLSPYTPEQVHRPIVTLRKSVFEDTFDRRETRTPGHEHDWPIRLLT